MVKTFMQTMAFVGTIFLFQSDAFSMEWFKDLKNPFAKSSKKKRENDKDQKSTSIEMTEELKDEDFVKLESSDISFEEKATLKKEGWCIIDEEDPVQDKWNAFQKFFEEF